MSAVGFDACPHPERDGKHEWYLTRNTKFGRHSLCRACGKLAPGLSIDPMCAVCKGPVELDRQNCDVCEACDDSAATDALGKERRQMTTLRLVTELKPCPFCGEGAEFDPEKGCMVCDGCGAEGPPADNESCDDPDEGTWEAAALAFWNQRRP